MRASTIWLFLAAWFVTRPLLAQAPAAPSPAAHYRLQNGLEVVLQPSHRQPLVAVIVAYEIGSRDDPPELSGLAHLVEHLTYRGSRHLGDLQGRVLLERAGAQHVNGITALDHTRYQMVVPRNALALALWIESERMAFTLEQFDAPRLSVEARVVDGEVQLGSWVKPNLERHAFNAFFGQGHPYAKPAPGFRLQDEVQLGDVQRFFQSGYRPNNARLVVVGDFDIGGARSSIERYFGPIANPASPLRRTARRAAFGTTSRLLYESQTNAEELLAVWPAPALATRERTAAKLVLPYLEGRLRRRLLRAGLARAVDLRIHELQWSPVLTLNVELTGSDRHTKVEERLAHQLTAALKLDWLKVLPRLRRAAAYREVSKLDLLDWGHAHLRSLRGAGQPFDLGRSVAEIEAVQPKDVIRFLDHFQAGRGLIAHLARPVEPLEPGDDDDRVLVMQHGRRP